LRGSGAAIRQVYPARGEVPSGDPTDWIPVLVLVLVSAT
jgi:hypothetical protein